MLPLPLLPRPCADDAAEEIKGMGPVPDEGGTFTPARENSQVVLPAEIAGEGRRSDAASRSGGEAVHSAVRWVGPAGSPLPYSPAGEDRGPQEVWMPLARLGKELARSRSRLGVIRGARFGAGVAVPADEANEAFSAPKLSGGQARPAEAAAGSDDAGNAAGPMTPAEEARVVAPSEEGRAPSEALEIAALSAETPSPALTMATAACLQIAASARDRLRTPASRVYLHRRKTVFRYRAHPTAILAPSSLVHDVPHDVVNKDQVAGAQCPSGPSPTPPPLTCPRCTA